jgi:PAS domain S-box-containing protein
MQPRGHRISRWIGVVLLGTGTTIAYFFPSPYIPSHLFFVGGVALVAYFGGWLAALVALAVPPVVLTTAPAIPVGHALSPTIECVFAAVTMLTARHRLTTLSASHTKLRALLASMNDVIFVLSREGRYVEVAPTNPQLLYRPIGDVIGRRIHDVFPRDQADFFVRHIQMALDERRSVPVDYRLDIGGREVWFSATVSRMDAEHVIWVARDITDRKSAERALEGSLEQLEQRVDERTQELTASMAERECAAAELLRSERMLVEAQEVGRIGSWELDLAANVLWWSEEQYRLFGLTPDGAPEGCERFLACISEECQAQFDLDIAVLYERGQHEWDWTVVAEGGVERQLRCRGRVICDENGEPLRLVGTSIDVTEAKRAEELLRLNEERFRLLARATNDAVWDCDLTTGLIWRGESFQILFGEQDCSDTAEWIERMHPHDRDRVMTSREEALRAGQMSWSSEYRFRRADGTWAIVLDRASIVRDSSKGAVRMLGAMMDLTERKQLESQLEQTKRVDSLGRVATSIAHEFNNVLMGIQPSIEIVRRGATSPAQLQAVTDNIVHAVKRGKRITDEILRFTRRSEPDIQCIEVTTFMERWQEDVRHVLGADIELVLRRPSSETFMSADSLQFGQVLTDLAANARDAMPLGGRLTVLVEPATSFSRFDFGVVTSPDRFLHFVVTDQGSGISPEFLPHIFEPLFTTKNGGIGLGLAISYQIVSQHHGHIFVESEITRGTSFHIFIPAALPAAEVQPAPIVSSLSGRRLLLVEDDPTVASGLEMLLEMDGVAVRVATCGADAVAAIEEFDPDVVLLDIGLPDMDGVEVFRGIESRWPGLPVLFSSGHADSARLETLLLRPSLGFIAKPYDFEACRQILTQLLECRAA